MKSNVIIGLLITIMLGLGSFSLKQSFDTNGILKAMDVRLTNVERNKEKDEQQDAQLRMLWQYGGWSESAIADTRYLAGQPPYQRPIFKP